MVYKDVLDEAGHSMLELLVCTGIMMIICSAALPKLVNMDKLYVKYETLRLMNTIRYTQTWAHQWDYTNGIREKAPRLYVATNRYNIKTSYHTWHPYNAGHQVRIKSNQRYIRFNRRGQSVGATIRIWKGDYEERIIIDTVGRARVETG